MDVTQCVASILHGILHLGSPQAMYWEVVVGFHGDRGTEGASGLTTILPVKHSYRNVRVSTGNGRSGRPSHRNPVTDSARKKSTAAPPPPLPVTGMPTPCQYIAPS